MADIVLASLGDVQVVMEAVPTSRTATEILYTISAVKLVRMRDKAVLTERNRKLERVVTPKSTAGLVQATVHLTGGGTVVLTLDEETESVSRHTFPLPLVAQSSPGVTLGWVDKSRRKTR